MAHLAAHVRIETVESGRGNTHPVAEGATSGMLASRGLLAVCFGCGAARAIFQDAVAMRCTEVGLEAILVGNDNTLAMLVGATSLPAARGRTLAVIF